MPSFIASRPRVGLLPNRAGSHPIPTRRWTNPSPPEVLNDHSSSHAGSHFTAEDSDLVALSELAHSMNSDRRASCGATSR